MFCKAVIVLVACFFVFEMIYASPSRIARDAPASEDSTKTIDDAIASFTSNLDNLLKNIQENEVFQNISSSIKRLGEEVHSQGQQLVEKIQKSSDIKTR